MQTISEVELRGPMLCSGLGLGLGAGLGLVLGLKQFLQHLPRKAVRHCLATAAISSCSVISIAVASSHACDTIHWDAAYVVTIQAD